MIPLHLLREKIILTWPNLQTTQKVSFAYNTLQVVGAPKIAKCNVHNLCQLYQIVSSRHIASPKYHFVLVLLNLAEELLFRFAYGFWCEIDVGWCAQNVQAGCRVGHKIPFAEDYPYQFVMRFWLQNVQK